MLALLDFTHFVATSGYAAIFVLSVLQSCCVPTSSELTLGYAGVLAAEGRLSLPGAVLAGAAGEVVGAYLAWAIGRYGGRAVVVRYGRYVLMSTRDLDRAEGWYHRHERWGVFGSRLLPVIRNFVAVPAGVAEVPLVRFGVLTALGSLVWDGAMALIGYGVGSSWHRVMKGFSDAGYLLGALAVLAVAVVIWHRWRSYREATGGAGRPDRPPAGGPPRAGRWEPAAYALKVPVRITAAFWALKLLSTAMGEAMSDSLVRGINPYVGVVVGFALFVTAMALQLRAPRYDPWRYWFAVGMVAVFGTQAADVLHIVLHIPYLVSSVFYLVVLVVVLRLWSRMEGTLSIHSIFTPRREVFYWLTVLSTFALGTAVGDLTATTFHLGYLGSGLMFIGLFCVPGVAYRFARADAVLTFWTAYILTRPLGASFADYFGFGPAVGGLGLGHPLATVIFLVPMVTLVFWVAATRVDTPSPARLSRRAASGRPPEPRWSPEARPEPDRPEAGLAGEDPAPG